MKNLFRALLLVLSIEISATAQSAPTLSIFTEGSYGESPRHGFQEIIAALRAKHVSFEQINSLEEAKGKWC